MTSTRRTRAIMCRWLDEIGVRELDDWEKVYRAIARIEALPAFPREARLWIGD